MSFHDDWGRKFDRSFAKMEKNSSRIAVLAVIGWLLFALLDVAILVGIVYVAVHFLGKVW